MGKLIYSMNVSLDGYVETPDHSLDWTNVNEELHRWFGDRVREAGALLYGRRLYEVMASYWPTAESDPAATDFTVDFARVWNPKPKIVFSTTLNNMNWSIGLEVTLSVLGFTNINTPTIGVMIYWANQHTALVAGIWWWIAFPVALVVMTFIGLFLLAVSMNEYIDPRSRLARFDP